MYFRKVDLVIIRNRVYNLRRLKSRLFPGLVLDSFIFESISIIFDKNITKMRLKTDNSRFSEYGHRIGRTVRE